MWENHRQLSQTIYSSTQFSGDMPAGDGGKQVTMVRPDIARLARLTRPTNKPLVQGPIRPGYRISIVSPSNGTLDHDGLVNGCSSFLGHKGEPWLGDISARLRDPDCDSYNLFAVAHKIEYPHLDGAGKTVQPAPPIMVGHVWLGYDGDTGMVGHVYTSSDHRKQGLASSMLSTILQVFFEERGGRFVVLGTDNEAAMSVYHQLGFCALHEPYDGDKNVMMARGVQNDGDPARAYMGAIQRQSIHWMFENEYFNGMAGCIEIEEITMRNLPSCVLLLNCNTTDQPKLPGLGITTGTTCEHQLLLALELQTAGKVLCAVAISTDSRRVHAIGFKPLGAPGDESVSKAEVFAPECCAAAQHVLESWLRERTAMLNQGVLLDEAEPLRPYYTTTSAQQASLCS